MPSTQSKILAGASLVLVGTAAHGLTRLVLNLIAGRSLGPQDFGLLTLCLAIVQFSALLWPTTLGSATTKYLAAESTSLRDSAIYRYLVMTSLGSSAVTAVIAGVGWFLLGDATWLGVATTATLCFLYGQYHLARGVLIGGQRFRRSTLLEFLLSAVCLLSAGLAHYWWNSNLGYAACLGAGLAAYALGRPRSVRAPSPPDRRTRRDINSYIFIGTIGTVASTGFLQISVIAASHWGGQTGAGLYGAALAVATPATIFAAALGSALLPSLSAAHASGQTITIGLVADRATKGLNALAVPLFGTLVILAGQATDLLWGAEYEESRPILRALLIAVMLRSCSIPAVTRLSATSTRSLALVTRISLVGVVASAALWIPLGSVYGPVGIAWGYVAGTAVTSATSFAVCWKRDGQRWGPLAACISSGTSILVAIALIDPELPWVGALGGAILFATIYAGMATLLLRSRPPHAHPVRGVESEDVRSGQ